MRAREEGGFDARQEAPRGSVIGLLLGLCLSLAVHLVFLEVILFAPSRLPPMPAASAYTVELVNPGAVGGQLLAGEKRGVKRAAKKSKTSGVKTAPPPKRARNKVVKGKVRQTPPKKARVKEAPQRKNPPLKRRAKVTKKKAAAKSKQRRAKVGKPPTSKPKRAAKHKAPAAAKSASRAPKAQAAPSRKASGRSGSGLDRDLAAAVKRAGAGGAGQGGDKKKLKGPVTIAPGQGPGGGGKVRGLEFLVYYNAMLSRIKDSWAWVGTGSDLKVRVRFSIQESGEIADIRLTESSGDRSYDQSVLRAVRRVRRLDPPPAQYRRDFGDVEIEFRPGDLKQRG